MELDPVWIDLYYAASPDVRVGMREVAVNGGIPTISLILLDLFVHYDERIAKLEKQVSELLDNSITLS